MLERTDRGSGVSRGGRGDYRFRRAATLQSQPASPLPAAMHPRYSIPPEELEISAIRAQGAGGQNVNKVSNAVHLRFDIAASTTLPQELRERLLQLGDQRISKDGVIIIKAQEFRSLEKNRAEALRRLEDLIAAVAVPRKKRRPTRPTRSSIAKRLETKARRAAVKSGRGKVGM